MDPDCVLNAEYDGCYYVSPAYVSSRYAGSHLHHNSNNSSGIISSSHDDRCRLAAAISKFNTNSHGLVMTLVSSTSTLSSSSSSCCCCSSNNHCSCVVDVIRVILVVLSYRGYNIKMSYQLLMML